MLEKLPKSRRIPVSLKSTTLFFVGDRTISFRNARVSVNVGFYRAKLFPVSPSQRRLSKVLDALLASAADAQDEGTAYPIAGEQFYAKNQLGVSE